MLVIFTNPFLPASVLKANTLPTANPITLVSLIEEIASIVASFTIASNSLVVIEVLVNRVLFFVAQFAIPEYTGLIKLSSAAPIVAPLPPE